MNSNFTVIIPTFNEEGNIGKLLDQIIITYPGLNVIVADDGSSDKTQEIVKKFSNKSVKLLDRIKKSIHGLSESVIDASLRTKTKDIIVMDADFQHPVVKIKDVMNMLLNNDIIICCRRSLPKEWPFSRKLVSFIAQILSRIRLLNKFSDLKDPNSGFFGIKTPLFKDIIKRNRGKIDGRGYKILFDILKYSPKDTKIGYVYYDFELRKAGYSKINKKHLYYFLKSLIR